MSRLIKSAMTLDKNRDKMRLNVATCESCINILREAEDHYCLPDGLKMVKEQGTSTNRNGKYCRKCCDEDRKTILLLKRPTLLVAGFLRFESPS